MPTVPTAPTFFDSVTASSTFNQLRDVLRFLQAKPIAQLRQTVGQTLTTASYTPISLDAEAFDLDPDNVGGHDNAVNNTRWTCRYPGYYIVSGLVTYVANATGSRYCGLRVNAVDVPGSYKSVGAFGSDVNGVDCMTMRIFLDISNYVELIGYQSSGGNLNTFVASTTVQSGLAIGWDRSQ